MEVILFSRSSPCPYCDAAKNLLHEHGIKFTEIIADLSESTKQQFREMLPPEVKTVPQIFVGGKHIGGYNELRHKIFEVVGDYKI